MTESKRRVLWVTVHEAGLEVQVELLSQRNRESSDAVWHALPIESTLGHVTASGGGIWIPSTIAHFGATRMVKREAGSVYLNCATQTISLTYGDVTESALVNEVGRVRRQDLATLERIGRLVWQRTITDARKSVVRVRVEKREDR